MSNSIEKQKHALVGISIAIAIISLIGVIGGIILIVCGAKTVMDEHLAGGLKIGFGVALVLIGGYFLVLGIYMLLVGSAVKATKGSIAEGNIPKAGTVNMIKCKNCGAEVKEGEAFCNVCGKSLSDKKVCPKCGATNMSENKKCSACGADLE